MLFLLVGWFCALVLLVLGERGADHLDFLPVRTDPMAPQARDFRDWLLSARPHPALADLAIAPAGVTGTPVWRPADTSWLASPFLPAPILSARSDPSGGVPGPGQILVEDALCIPPSPAVVDGRPRPALDCWITSEAGVWRTDDGGATWREAEGSARGAGGAPLAMLEGGPVEANPREAGGLRMAEAGTVRIVPGSEDVYLDLDAEPPASRSVSFPSGTRATARLVGRLPTLSGNPVYTAAPRTLAIPGSGETSIAFRAPEGLHSVELRVAEGADGAIRAAATRPNGVLQEVLFLAEDRVVVRGVWDGAFFRLDRRTLPTDAAIRHLSLGLEHPDVSFGDYVFATSGWNDGGENGDAPVVLRSVDGGSTWERLSWRAGLPPIAYLVFLGLAVTPGLTLAVRRRLAQRRRPPTGVAEHGLSDSELRDEDEDATELRPLVSATSRFMRHPRTRLPLSIAIDAPWGAGKTSLMRLVAGDLKKRGGYPVWFNAWYHQDEESLLAALMDAVAREATPHPVSLSGIWFRLRLLGRRAGRPSGLVMVAALLVLSLAGVWLIANFDAVADEAITFLANRDTAEALTTWLSDWEKHLTDLGLGGLVVVAALIMAQFRVITSGSRALMQHARRAVTIGRVGEVVGMRDRFAREFGEIATLLSGSATTRLALFIDDLDRCDDDTIRAILRTASFLASSGPCFVVLGIDRSRVESALRKGGESQPERYLEKIFTMVERLPSLRPEHLPGMIGSNPGANRGAEPAIIGLRRRVLRGLDASVPSVALLVSLGIMAYDIKTRYSAAVVEASFPMLDAAVAVEDANPTTPESESAGAAAAEGAATIVAIATARQVPEAADDPSNAGPSRTMLPPPEPTRTPLEPMPWLVAALLALTAAIAYVLWRRDEDVPDDAPEFKAALTRWAELVRAGSPTPRAIKRFRNRARFASLRAREYRAVGVHAEFDSAALTALVALDTVIPGVLASTLDIESSLEELATRAGAGSDGTLAAQALQMLRDDDLTIEADAVSAFLRVTGEAAR